MTNPRHEEKFAKNVEDTVRRAGERTTDQTERIGLAAAQAGEDVAKASASLLRQNAEMLQNTWRIGVDMATAIMGRSTEEFGRTLGLSGDEAQQATERSARNAETILYSATAAAKGINGISREYSELVPKQIESNFDRMTELWRCRTPQDLAAIQSDLVRETLVSILENNRRLADLSLRVAEDAGKHITENMKRAA